MKALNTMNCNVMVDPSLVPGDHAVMICGDDADAKRQVSELLASFGWTPAQVVDLGGIRASRGLEMWLPLWLSLMGALGTPNFNVALMRN